MRSDFPYRLYLVIAEENCLGNDMFKITEQAIAGGVDIVQLREKNSSTPQFLAKAQRMQELLSKQGVPLIINDNLEVAMAVNAFGIHVGRTDCSPLIIKKKWPTCKSIGYSIEELSQLTSKEAAIADCLGISPIFRTPTKTDTINEWGLNGIQKIRTITPKPLIAIGNINANNAQQIIKAGADCIAVVSAICHAKDPSKAAFVIRNQIEKT